MNLSAADLQAIKQLIDDSIDQRVPKLVQPMLDALEERTMQRIDTVEGGLAHRIDDVEERFVRRMDDAQVRLAHRIDDVEERFVRRMDELDETLSIQTEHGLQEIRDRLSGLEDKVGSVIRMQQAEVDRVDKHDKVLTGLSKAFRSA